MPTYTLHQTLQTLEQCRADLYRESLGDDPYDDPHVAAQVVDIIAHLDAAIRLMTAKNRRVQHAAYEAYLKAGS